jgi:hypothetical protein
MIHLIVFCCMLDNSQLTTVIIDPAWTVQLVVGDGWGSEYTDVWIVDHGRMRSLRCHGLIQ